MKEVGRGRLFRTAGANSESSSRPSSLFSHQSRPSADKQLLWQSLNPSHSRLKDRLAPDLPKAVKDLLISSGAIPIQYLEPRLGFAYPAYGSHPDLPTCRGILNRIFNQVGEQPV